MGQENQSSNKIEEPITAKKVIQAKDEQEQAKKYNKYVEEKTPKPDLLRDMLYAFFVGGVICTIGQIFTNFYLSRGLEEETAASFTTLSLVLLAVVLTGFNLYQKITKVGGAGSLVPITGFANSVVASAIEYQTEGQVFGIGCKIFTIAGPVILYGIVTSWGLGVVYWIGKMLGIV